MKKWIGLWLVGAALAHAELPAEKTGIVRTLWVTPSQARASAARHRSPLVLQCIEDYLSGQRYPLDLLHTHAGVYAKQQRD